MGSDPRFELIVGDTIGLTEKRNENGGVGQGLMIGMGISRWTGNRIDAARLVGGFDLKGLGKVRFKDVSAGLVAVDIPKES